MAHKNEVWNHRLAERTDAGYASAFETVASRHLSHRGLAIDFDAGSTPYDYALQLGTTRAEAMAGGSERDYLWGRAGSDSLWGADGSDNLFGGTGDDVLTGGDGGDRLFGGGGHDSLYGGMEADGLMGGTGNDLLDEGAGHGDLNGGPGDDVLIGGPGADAFMIGMASGHDVIRDFTAGPGMFDHLAIGDLRWSDLSVSDTVEGVKVAWTGGSILLEGVMKAELSQDDFMFADAPELPPSARPADSALPERATQSSNGPAIAAPPAPHSAADSIADALIRRDIPISFAFHGEHDYALDIGTTAADLFAGSYARDQLFGRDGNDQLHGHAADDILQGDAGDDQLSGGGGSDRIDGGTGADQLAGGDAEDELMGGDGVDRIDAGAGHDMIAGGMGDDIIIGGSGADAFMVMPDSGHDLVLDFEATGQAQGAFDHIAFMDIMPEQVSVSDTAGGAMVAWDNDGDGLADGSVLLQGVMLADLRQSDFMFNEEPAFVAGIGTAGSDYIF